MNSKYMNILWIALACVAIAFAALYARSSKKGSQAQTPVPGKDGDKYVPYEKRSGAESVVYFTRDLSAEGLIKAYEKVSGGITGSTSMIIHSGRFPLCRKASTTSSRFTSFAFF